MHFIILLCVFELVLCSIETSNDYDRIAAISAQKAKKFASIPEKLRELVLDEFTFPFTRPGQSPPDGRLHYLDDVTFTHDEHVVVLYNVTMFPGLTFRALKYDAGALNVHTADVEFEVEVPTIGGYVYVSPNASVQDEFTEGAFKLNYGVQNMKGILVLGFYDGWSTDSLVMSLENMDKVSVEFYFPTRNSLTNILTNAEPAKHKSIELKVSYALKMSLVENLKKSFRRILQDAELSLLLWVSQIYRTNRTRNLYDDFGPYADFLQCQAHDLFSEFHARFRDKAAKSSKKPALKILSTDGIHVMAPIKFINEPFTSFYTGRSQISLNPSNINVTLAPVAHKRNNNEIEVIGSLDFGNITVDYPENFISPDDEDVQGPFVNLTGVQFLVRMTFFMDNSKSPQFEVDHLTTGLIQPKISNINKYWWGLRRHIDAWVSGSIASSVVPTIKRFTENQTRDVLITWDPTAAWKTFVLKPGVHHQVETECEQLSAWVAADHGQRPCLIAMENARKSKWINFLLYK